MHFARQRTNDAGSCVAKPDDIAAVSHDWAQSGRIRWSRRALANRAANPRLGHAASVPCADTVSLAGGTRIWGLPLRGIAITAPNAGAFLTGLAAALAFGPASFAGVAITALQAGASK